MRNRRAMFLHRGAALGVPILVAGAVPRQPRADRLACAQWDEDPVVAAALRQFKAGIGAQIAGQGDGARLAASALRTMAAHGKAQRLDEQFRQALQREVHVHGEQNVLVRRGRRARVAADAREFGRDRTPDLVDPDTDARRRVLESLLSVGVTPHFLRAAELFDTVAADLDAPAGSPKVPHGDERPRPGAGLREWISHTEIAMSIASLSPSAATGAFFAGVYVGARIHQQDRFGRRSFQEFG